MFCCRLILAIIIGCIMFISNTDGLVYRWVCLGFDLLVVLLR